MGFAMDKGVPLRTRLRMQPGQGRTPFLFSNAPRNRPMTDLLKTSLNRRTVLQAATVGAVGVSPALRALVHAQGSDAPE